MIERVLYLSIAPVFSRMDIYLVQYQMSVIQL